MHWLIDAVRSWFSSSTPHTYHTPLRTQSFTHSPVEQESCDDEDDDLLGDPFDVTSLHYLIHQSSSGRGLFDESFDADRWGCEVDHDSWSLGSDFNRDWN